MADDESQRPVVEPADAFAGVPDGLERLWTPHRMAYIGGQDKPTGDGPGDGCPFCRMPSLPDEEGLVEPHRRGGGDPEDAIERLRRQPDSPGRHIVAAESFECHISVLGHRRPSCRALATRSTRTVTGLRGDVLVEG